MINFSITNPNGHVLNKTISNNDLLLSFGGGNFDISYGDNEDLGYGSFTFIADEDFIAWVELWGADGAAYGVDKMKDASGIGGYTKSLVNFKKDIRYTITAGQAGYFRNKNTHGGGGSGYINSSIVVNGVTTAGNLNTPANSGDSQRNGAGSPGATAWSSGANGIIILTPTAI